MKVSFDTDKRRAMEDTRIWAALALTPEEKVTVQDPREMERLADALPVERAASRWIVSTDPDEHIEKIKPYVDMGFRHLVFHAPGNDQARFLKLYGELVLPKLRHAGSTEDVTRLQLLPAVLAWAGAGEEGAVPSRHCRSMPRRKRPLPPRTSRAGRGGLPVMCHDRPAGIVRDPRLADGAGRRRPRRP